jgi:hypothetical protein
MRNVKNRDRKAPSADESAIVEDFLNLSAMYSFITVLWGKSPDQALKYYSFEL